MEQVSTEVGCIVMLVLLVCTGTIFIPVESEIYPQYRKFYLKCMISSHGTVHRKCKLLSEEI